MAGFTTLPVFQKPTGIFEGSPGMQQTLARRGVHKMPIGIAESIALGVWVYKNRHDISKGIENHCEHSLSSGHNEYYAWLAALANLD